MKTDHPLSKREFSIANQAPKGMIAIVILTLIFALLPVQTLAFDHLVNFISENYRELNKGDADGPKIYHTIQVETPIGSKVIMLKGKDYEYRKWLRQYLSRYHKLIIKVPNDEEPLFKIAKLFEIEVNSIHPISGSSWKKDPTIIPILPVLTEFKGEKHILIVDDDPEKRGLIEMVVRDLGFPVTIATNPYDALNIFKQQPDKFRLIIADAVVSGELSTTSLVRHIIDTDPEIPVILGTDYREKTMTSMLTDFFSGFSRIIIKPVVLQDLSKTILQILEKNV